MEDPVVPDCVQEGLVLTAVLGRVATEVLAGLAAGDLDFATFGIIPVAESFLRGGDALLDHGEEVGVGVAVDGLGEGEGAFHEPQGLAAGEPLKQLLALLG